MAQVLTQTSLTNDSAPQPLQNGSADGQAAGSSFLRFSGGLILPPPEIKGVPPSLHSLLIFIFLFGHSVHCIFKFSVYLFQL